jgi:hypothetical protein
MNEVEFKMSTREELAEYAHKAWSGWMKCMFSKSLKIQDTIVIPADLVERWSRQMTTSYKDLPEHEQESGLLEADRMLSIINRK